MNLRFLNSKSSWVDPRIITSDLALDYPKDHQTLNMARYLKELWLYKFGEQNTKFMQEHPKEFLEMYSTLSAQHQHRTSQLPQDHPNIFPDYTNVLFTTPWHHIYVTGCLRYLAEHSLPIHSCEALTQLPTPIHEFLTDLHDNVRYQRNINGFTKWLKEQEGAEDVLQACLSDRIHEVMFALESDRTTYHYIEWQEYAHLQLSEENEQSLYQALLLDTIFQSPRFTPLAQEHFPTYTAHFQQWKEWMTSLDADAFEDIEEEGWRGDEIIIHLSTHAYELLQTLPRLQGFNAPIITPPLEHLFESP